jgi:hypothetical protein
VTRRFPISGWTTSGVRLALLGSPFLDSFRLADHPGAMVDEALAAGYTLKSIWQQRNVPSRPIDAPHSAWFEVREASFSSFLCVLGRIVAASLGP